MPHKDVLGKTKDKKAQGWNRYQKKSQHRKVTLEKKILLLFLPGFIFNLSIMGLSLYHWAIPAPNVNQFQCRFAPVMSHWKQFRFGSCSLCWMRPDNSDDRCQSTRPSDSEGELGGVYDSSYAHVMSTNGSDDSWKTKRHQSLRLWGQGCLMYLSSCLSVDTPSRTLHSSWGEKIFLVQDGNLRALVTGRSLFRLPLVWNNLPAHIQPCSSLSHFKTSFYFCILWASLPLSRATFADCVFVS